jgi:hypothetical protein
MNIHIYEEAPIQSNVTVQMATEQTLSAQSHTCLPRFSFSMRRFDHLSSGLIRTSSFVRLKFLSGKNSEDHSRTIRLYPGTHYSCITVPVGVVVGEGTEECSEKPTIASKSILYEEWEGASSIIIIDWRLYTLAIPLEHSVGVVIAR